MFKQFIQKTIKDKGALASFQIELLQKGRQALDAYREVTGLLEKVNSWPHPMWIFETFQDYTAEKGALLLEGLNGKLKTSFMEAHQELRQFKALTPEQKFFFLYSIMELSQVKNLKNHTFKVDDDGYPSLFIEEKKEAKMSFFLAQELKEENVRLKAELEEYKKEEYFG
tara:strand:- start:1466 stop:1972 length:507 start_codon:yes stop_codon:yes gene_type:complete